MRDAANIQIQELIIHILDPGGQGLVLSGVEMPLDNSQPLVEYFTGHIQNTLGESSIKAARFRNVNPQQPSGYCQAVLNGEVTLAEGSQELARALYGIMENDMRITSGDLAVALFSAENYPYTRFLAILKIDPAQIFRHVIREDSAGNQYVSFEPETMAFTSERLQKCAVIQPLEPRHPNYDMLLLDRQARLEDRAVARFFTESFLDAEEAYDPRKYTEKFVRSIALARNRAQDILTPGDEAKIDRQLLEAVNSPRMNVDTWVEALPLKKAIKQEIDQSLRENIPDRQFSFDPQVAQRLTRKIKMRGDDGLRVEVNSENYWTVVVSEERIDDEPDREPFYRIVIETEDWRKVV